MPKVFEHHLTVNEDEIDPLGHANNVAYIEWMQAAAIEHTRAQGWPGRKYRELGRGWVVRSHQIEYLRPALPGDEIVVRTWVANMRKVRSLRRFRILRVADEELLARAATDWAFIDYTTGQLVRIPPEVAEAFVVVGEDEDDPRN